jgi:hypothetical protein
MSTNFVQRLVKVRTLEQFKKALKNASSNDIQQVVDLSANVLRKKFPLGKKVVNNIIANRRLLRHLVHPRFGWTSKKKYLIQHGGGLKGLLGRVAKVALPALKPIMPAVGGATGGVVKAAVKPIGNSGQHVY